MTNSFLGRSFAALRMTVAAVLLASAGSQLTTHESRKERVICRDCCATSLSWQNCRCAQDEKPVAFHFSLFPFYFLSPLTSHFSPLTPLTANTSAVPHSYD